MIRTVDSVLDTAFAHAPWLLPSEPSLDIVVVMSAALGPTWSIRRETDCQGEVSIIVLPLDDDAKPAFVLYEKHGMARVATVAGDDWEGDRGFASVREAAAYIVAEIAGLPGRMQAAI